jgi:hypothetical protein
MEGLPFLAGGGVNLTELSKMLHLEIPNITKAVTKHLPVSKTCQHVPTLNPHVRLQHHAIRIHHQVKIISLL